MMMLRWVWVWVCVATLLLSACSNGPFFYFAGGKLAGEEQPFSAAAVPVADSLIQLETRPSDPYSVNLNARIIERQVYLDPTEERAWYQHMVANANVRIRFADDQRVYAARAEVVKDSAVLSQFEGDRIVMRIVPR